jgi:SPP1 gp7 family putative phage head morphogenesis protein
VTGLPIPEADAIRRALRRNAGSFLDRLYRHEMLLARTVRGLQIEAAQEYNRDVMQPLLRLIGGRLATFEPRGMDVIAAVHPELRALEADVVAAARMGSATLRRTVADRMEALTKTESDWVRGLVKREGGQEPPPPSVAVAPTARPVLGTEVEQWYGQILETPVADKTRAWVQTGIQQGLTTDEIVRGLKGTRTTPGILEAPRHAVSAMVRTQATHVSTQTRMDTFSELGVERWRFVTTLDTRTCRVCAEQDGQTYDVGEGKQPPLHPNCRCTAVPDLGGEPEGERASADGGTTAATRYPDWLKRQPAKVQDRMLGPTLGKAWRAGKVDFKDMVGDNMQPISIDQLRKNHDL